MTTNVRPVSDISMPARPPDHQVLAGASRTNGHADGGAHDTSMKAIVQDTYGSAEVLGLQEDRAPGQVGDDDVLLRVHAAGVHIGDWHVMTGQPYLMRIMGFGFRAPKARVRGMDVAGTVEAVGKNVTRFQAGDEVFGTCDGAFAEYACARADKLAPKPTNLTFEQAAAVPTSACTALQALRDAGEIKPGQTGPDHRCVWRRGAVRGADRQVVRRRSDRRVQHAEGGHGPLARRRPCHRLHPGRLHPQRAAV